MGLWGTYVGQTVKVSQRKKVGREKSAQYAILVDELLDVNLPFLRN